MTYSRGSKIRTNGRSELQPTLGKELRRFLHEFCFVCALLMLLGQTFPAFASTFGGWTPVCSSTGIVLAQEASDDGAPSRECSRCSLCMTGHTPLGDLPVKSIDIGWTDDASNMFELDFWAVHLVLPDHLLPFSGAPPPAIQVGIMQHNFRVPVSLTPTNMTFMPEFISWL